MQGQTTSLYKYQAGPHGVAGNWELFDGNVRPNFFNSNEDSRSAKPEWHVEAGELETKVSITDVPLIGRACSQ